MANTPKNKNKPGRAARSRLRWKWTLAIGALAVILVVCLVYGFWASSFDLRQVREMAERSTVFDMDGNSTRAFAGRKSRAGEALPSLAVSSSRRYWRGKTRAFTSITPASIPSASGARSFATSPHASAKEGASTLTQQLARNSYDELGQRKSMDRKLLEAFVAMRIEQRYSKDEILEFYVNRIYFGSGVYGIEAASRAYFGKSAADLTLSEAAMIAGIIRAPTYSSPILKHPERAAHARDNVLDRMVKLDSASAKRRPRPRKRAPNSIILTKTRIRCRRRTTT